MRKKPGFTAQRLALCTLTTACLVLLLAGCSKTDITVAETNSAGTTALAARTDLPGTTVYHGPVTRIGNGHIRSIAVMDKFTDKPLIIGFEMTNGALENLPRGHGNGGHHTAYMVKLHPKVKDAGIFDHLVADWNPHGHEPGPYLPPHFDFHFYLLSYDERMQITATDPLSMAPLPAGYLPDDYIGPLGAEPEMGGHCVDVTSPELNGFPFTHTFIYGAYDSKVAFYEPMITLDYLLTDNNGEFAVKQPAHVSKTGYYPTRYSITKDADGTRYVMLTGFVFRIAG